MLNARSLGFGLYEIDRNKDFIFDVNEIMNLSSGDIDKSLRSAVTTNNETELATLILNYAPLELKKLDINKKSLLHIACEKGNIKILKMILDTVQADGSSD